MLYLEDLAAGQSFRTATPIELTAADVLGFGAAFDPQPFHTDPQAAEDSFFQGLAASGWHTAAVTMRLLVTQGPALAGGIIGAGVEELKWPRATRPGDALSLEIKVLEVREMRTKPDLGLVRVKVTTLNQRGEIAQVMVANLVVPKRPTAP
jgi:acyl dehydratase